MAFLVALSACSDAEFTFGGPLELTISSNAPISVADSLVLTYDIRGRSLLGMEVLWGDASSDSLFFSGAQSAGGRRSHTFTSPGSYVVTATVDDAFEGSLTRELTVTVSP